ncbi:hypothetical protein L6452_19137 [Arctium lappa]|uniref:Uncharacterized protein n=1 Tax=Arctium lappa TaxID=4217 RepID=A0ACB9B849_ARCLA|nr:hypothetical protein L6452_19137 [Arctium lappa]
MIRLPGGRKRSERLMKKNSFSNYKNTTENPLDKDGNEIRPKSKWSIINKPPVVKPHIEVNKQCCHEGNMNNILMKCNKVLVEEMKLMDDKIGLVVAAKYDTEMLLESLIAKYHGDEIFKKYKCIHSFYQFH